MKRPTWMILVGVLIILFGFWGMLGGAFSIVSAVYVAMEPEMETMSGFRDGQAPSVGSSSNMAEEIQHDEQAQKRPLPQHDETLAEPSHLLTENPSWVVTISLISLLVSGAYLLAGIFLITKSFGPRFFYYVIAVSVLWSMAQAVLYSQAQLDVLMAYIPAFTPSMVIDLILAGVVFVGTRLQPPQQTLTKDRKLSAVAFSIISKPIKVGVPVITGAFAALCVVAFPLWLMGMPGVNNEYARGWEMGLHVIILYPIAWTLVFGIAHFLKKKMSVGHQRALEVGVSMCLSLFLGLALLRLGQALRLIAT